MNFVINNIILGSCIDLIKSIEIILNYINGINVAKKDGSYTEKYQDYVPCSYGYKLICADNKYSESAKKIY